MKALKVLAMLLVAALLFAACGPNEGAPGQNTTSKATTRTTSPATTTTPGTSITTPGSETGTTLGPATSAPTTSQTSTDLFQIGTLDNNNVVWGPGRQFNSKNQPTACINLQNRFGKYDAYFMADDVHKVYLTFDLGYEAGHTAKLLDVLKDNDVHAVFFLTLHYMKTQPDLVKRMLDEGHVIGNHTDRHFSFPSTPLEQCQEDVLKVHNYMLENHGYEMKLFRFPAGEFSERTLAMMQLLGYKTLFWSFAYRDYDEKNQPSVETAANTLIAGAHDGAIYLLHVVSEVAPLSVERLIPALREQGYEIALFEG